MKDEPVNPLEEAEKLYQQGVAYEKGELGLPVDLEKAAECYRQAARLNNPKALFRVAVAYEKGLSVDEKEAAKRYFQAAKLKNPEALNRLGVACEKGELGFPVDLQKAYAFYVQAARLKNPAALNRLAVAYEKGELGLPVDLKKAYTIYVKAANLNNPEALYRLGVANEKEELGLSDSHFSDRREKAVPYYLQAADLGHKDALYRVAVAYETGNLGFGRSTDGFQTRELVGIQSDQKKAFQFYKQAADLGHKDALNRLAVACEKGDLDCLNLAVDEEETSNLGQIAIHLYQQAADLGQKDALYRLAVAYEKGEFDFSVDEKEASKRYIQAADLGHKDALYRVAVAYEKGEWGLSVDEKEASKRYIQAADLEQEDAVHRLAVAYEKGELGLPVDEEKAYEYCVRDRYNSSSSLVDPAHEYEYGEGGRSSDFKQAIKRYWWGLSKNLQGVGSFFESDAEDGFWRLYQKGVPLPVSPKEIQQVIDHELAKKERRRNYALLCLSYTILGQPKKALESFKKFEENEGWKLGDGYSYTTLHEMILHLYLYGGGAGEDRLEANIDKAWKLYQRWIDELNNDPFLDKNNDDLTYALHPLVLETLKKSPSRDEIKSVNNYLKRIFKTFDRNRIHIETDCFQKGKLAIEQRPFIYSTEGIFHFLGALPLYDKKIFTISQQYFMEAIEFCLRFLYKGCQELSAQKITGDYLQDLQQKFNTHFLSLYSSYFDMKWQMSLQGDSEELANWRKLALTLMRRGGKKSILETLMDSQTWGPDFKTPAKTEEKKRKREEDTQDNSEQPPKTPKL